MDVFLDAECVFTALADRGIIVDKDWKSRHPETAKFTAHFSMAKSHGIISFEVRKKDNRYFITTRSLEIVAYIQHLNIKDLFTECLV
jgi:hypothetical protein